MTIIQNYVDDINDELHGAKEYAEKYLEFKSRNMMTWANRYKEMSNDELKHANYIHEIAVQEIESLKNVYTPPVMMQEAWDNAHKVYVEKTAWIKQMLAM